MGSKKPPQQVSVFQRGVFREATQTKEIILLGNGPGRFVSCYYLPSLFKSFILPHGYMAYMPIYIQMALGTPTPTSD